MSDSTTRSHHKAEKESFKPDIPEVPEALRERTYEPSGVCSIGTFLMMVFVGVLVSVLIGVVGYFVGTIVPPLLRGVAQWGIVGQIAAVALVIIIGIGFPLILGLLIGAAPSQIGKEHKCRSPRLSAAAGLLSGLTGYAAFLFTALSKTGSVHLTSRVLASSFGQGGLSVWLYIALVVDALILVWTAASFSMFQAQHPFCESCQAWYIQSNEGLFSLKLAEPLIESLASGSIQNLSSIKPVAMGVYPHLALKVSRCSCEKSDVALEATVIWEEVKVDKEGKAKRSKKTERLLHSNHLVPAELGRELERMLFEEREEEAESAELEKTKAVLYAFEIRSQEAFSEMPAQWDVHFTRTSDQKLKDKIRTLMRVWAKVVIISSDEWNAPVLSSFSQQDLKAAFPEILRRVKNEMAKRGLPSMSILKLTNQGKVLRNPVSDRMFLIYKLQV